MGTRMVILYGQSMLLSLVADSLANSSNLRIAEAATWEDVDCIAAQFPPDVLIYDLGSAQESRILPLLFKNSHLLLIGLDVETNRAILLAGQEANSLTIERIKEIIEKEY